MEEILKSAEKLFTNLDPTSRELLLDAVTGFRDSIASLKASPELAKQIETVAKQNISGFLLLAMRAFRQNEDEQNSLFDEISQKSLVLCPRINEAINSRFHANG